MVVVETYQLEFTAFLSGVAMAKSKVCLGIQENTLKSKIPGPLDLGTVNTNLINQL
jgi:hypothetical protein